MHSQSIYGRTNAKGKYFFTQLLARKSRNVDGFDYWASTSEHACVKCASIGARRWFLREPTMNLLSRIATRGYIFARGSLSVSANATAETAPVRRASACMRHTPSSRSASAYTECTRICSRIIKSMPVLFDQTYTGRPADETGERYLWKRNEWIDGRTSVATLVIIPLRR